MTSSTPALVLENLVKVAGGRHLLDRASARFELGRVHAVIGRSGAGKSVLMKCAVGLLALDEGEVTLGGEPAPAGAAGERVIACAGQARAFEQLRQSVAFVHQDPALLDDLTVLENAAFVAVRKEGASGLARAHRWLTELGAEHLAEQKPPQLSPSQLRRVALARALATRPRVLVVDEPTTGLDRPAAAQVDQALAGLFTRQSERVAPGTTAGRGRAADVEPDALGALTSTLILITHDLRSLAMLEPHLCFVHEGRVGWQGSYADRFAAGGHDDAARHALLSGRPLRAPQLEASP